MFVIDQTVTGKVDWLDDVFIILFDRDGTNKEETMDFIRKVSGVRKVVELPEDAFKMADQEGNITYPLGILVVGSIMSRSTLKLYGMDTFDTKQVVPGIEGSRPIKIYCCAA